MSTCTPLAAQPLHALGESSSIPRILLSEREAAEALGISTRTLFSLRQAGDIPFKKLKGRVLYPVEGLTRWAMGTDGDAETRSPEPPQAQPAPSTQAVH